VNGIANFSKLDDQVAVRLTWQFPVASARIEQTKGCQRLWPDAGGHLVLPYNCRWTTHCFSPASASFTVTMRCRFHMATPGRKAKPHKTTFRSKHASPCTRIAPVLLAAFGARPQELDNAHSPIDRCAERPDNSGSIFAGERGFLPPPKAQAPIIAQASRPRIDSPTGERSRCKAVHILTHRRGRLAVEPKLSGKVDRGRGVTGFFIWHFLPLTGVVARCIH
jgi:hypothetical protein